MMKNITACQATRNSLTSSSNRIPVPTCMLKFSWCLRNEGLRSTIRRVWFRVASVCHTVSKKGLASKQTRPIRNYQAVLNLQPGEVVIVKSEQEILETLDENGKHKGLLWMPNMVRFCGKKYTVFRRIERVRLESTGEIRKLKNTVLLDGVMCENLYGCDRSCLHFWREAWLRRVERVETHTDRLSQPGGSS